MNEQEFSELAAGHALLALSEADETRYLDALRANPEWETEAAADAEAVAGLAETVSPAAPPAQLRAALLAQIAVTPQVSMTVESAQIDREQESVRRSPMRILFALAACLAVLLGLGIGAVALNNQLNRPASVVALEQIEAAADAQQASVVLEAGGEATAHWSGDLGSAVLVTEGLEQLADDKTYQLWFVRGETALPAGLFESDSGKSTALLDGEMHTGDVIAVTVETAGGSPTGVPTSDPIIVIPTA